MATANNRLADVDRSVSEIIAFDDSKLAKVKPGLAEAEGFALSPAQLRGIFGINSESFGELPSRIVVPDLASHQANDGSYRVAGYLYVVEPVEWVPRIRHGATVPLSTLKSDFQENDPILESELNSLGVAVQLATDANGSYRGTKTEPLTDNPIPGNLSSCPIHQLTVFPMLRVRALKRQRIDLHVASTGGDKGLWWANSDKSGYWDQVRVHAERIGPVSDFQLHPIPLKGPAEVARLVFILPVPQFSSNGEIEVTTLISRSGWYNWFIWEECPWEVTDELLVVAAPHNQAAFEAATTWTPLASTVPEDVETVKPLR
ncbi:hypothetical protein FMUND_15662 [Fusarium mundagurra]|uniref:Uncharacterized protein n=1 Tax=Fusarium mundagurra TaxID=1567541 RepID=A0A8H5XN25_9HYPO|nr:hypothetical protein FMUND_15662 [Fusarium mundagurra]